MPPTAKHVETREIARDLLDALESRSVPTREVTHHTATPLDDPGAVEQWVHMTLPASAARRLAALLREGR